MKIKDGILVKVEEKDIKGGHLTIPPKVKGIGPKACAGLRLLRTVSIPKSVVVIFESAFEGSNLKEVELTNYVTIKDRAFADCRELKKFKADKITSIPKYCFVDCKSLEEVNLGEGLAEIGKGAFRTCHSLKEIALPDTVEVVEDFAFCGCYQLEHIKFSESLQGIGDYAFAECRLSKNEWKNHQVEWETIKLPEYVTYIGDGAFANNFASFVIPKYCSFIGRDAFERGGNKGKGESNRINKIEFNENGTSTISMEHGEDVWVDEINPQTIPVISKHPKLKEQLLKDMKDPKLARVYAHLNFWLTEKQFEDFYANKNMKFFKQISDNFYLGNDDIFTLLYNLGAFSKPVETTSTTKSGKEVTKKIDYAQKVCGLFVDDERLLKLFSQNGIHNSTMVWHFEEMGFKGFNKEFTEFFLDKANLTELLEEEKQNPGFIARCFNEFEQFQAQNTSNKGSQRQLKPTVGKLKAYFAREKLAGVPEEQRELVIKVEQYLPLKKSIKRALKIDAERKRKKTPDHLIEGGVDQRKIMSHINEKSEEIKGLAVSTLRDLKEIADNEFTFEYLSKSDPANFILGKLCNCCAHLEGAGYGIMHASIVSPHVQNLVIRDKDGIIVAKSTLYINPRRGYGVFNNVEVSEKYVKDGHNSDGYSLKQIFKTYDAAVETFAEKYNAEHPKKPIKIITVGMKNNDLIDEIRGYDYPIAEGREKKRAISYSRYGRYGHRYKGDSGDTQRIMWEMGVEDEQSLN